MTLAQLPAPPYYVVTFAAQRRDGDHGYAAMADEMVALAEQQPGYLAMKRAGAGRVRDYQFILER